MRKKRNFTLFIIWLILVLLVTAFLVSQNCPKYYSLLTRGVSTQGIIIGKEPDNHQFIHYSFYVGNSYFEDIGRCGYGTPEYTQIKVGDKLKVVYLPKQPQVSCLGEPREYLDNEISSIPFAALLIPSVFILGLSIKFKI